MISNRTWARSSGKSFLLFVQILAVAALLGCSTTRQGRHAKNLAPGLSVSQEFKTWGLISDLHGASQSTEVALVVVPDPDRPGGSSADGREATLEVYDSIRGKIASQVLNHRVRKLAISPSGHRIAISSYAGEVVVYDRVLKPLWKKTTSCELFWLEDPDELLCFHDDDPVPGILWERFASDGQRIESERSPSEGLFFSVSNRDQQWSWIEWNSKKGGSVVVKDRLTGMRARISDASSKFFEAQKISEAPERWATLSRPWPRKNPDLIADSVFRVWERKPLQGFELKSRVELESWVQGMSVDRALRRVFFWGQSTEREQKLEVREIVGAVLAQRASAALVHERASDHEIGAWVLGRGEGVWTLSEPSTRPDFEVAIHRGREDFEIFTPLEIGPILVTGNPNTFWIADDRGTLRRYDLP
jgi:hypothetical protein